MPKNKLVLVGGGLGAVVVLAAVYFLFLGSSSAPPDAEAAAEAEAEAEAIVPVRVAGKLGPHVTLQDRVFTLVSPPEAARYAKLEIVIEFETDDPTWFEISGEALVKRLEAFEEELPIVLIEDAITTTVSAKSADDIASIAGKEVLREEIRQAVSALLPEPQVRRVLFTNFITQ